MPDRAPLKPNTVASRLTAIAFAGLLGLGAAGLVFEASIQDGLQTTDVLRALLIWMTTSWLAWGAAQALLGLVPRRIGVGDLSGIDPRNHRTVILVPICNEDARATFSRVAAMDISLAEAGLTGAVDFAILSDTRDDTLARVERQWFDQLHRDREGAGRIYYRRRTDNWGRKAGNIEEFITRSGGAYEFAVILDADSLMEGETVAEMVRRMVAEPRLGLLQTLPQIVGAQSLFGRAMQFSSNFFSPVFSRGLAHMQGDTGPFWGHNAIVRVRAFAESCGLPELKGRPPFGGHILSHDYVEAALLARAGWIVRLDEDLTGSYEEGPENIVAYAKRDRRWCQGNLQHSRLLTAPGLRFWSRFVFLQGITAYIVSLIWAAFLIVSLVAFVTAPLPNYFPDPYQLFPSFPSDRTREIVGLGIGVIGLLILPKFLILVHAILTRRTKGFGGAFTTFRSVLGELLLSSLMAPVMLMYQSRAVLQVLMGRDGGWPANQRGEGRLSLREAWAASGWIVTWGTLVLAALTQFAPTLALWLLPVCVPMMAAPLLLAWSSRPARSRLFRVPGELEAALVVTLYHGVAANWPTTLEPQAAPESDTGEGGTHVTA